MARIELRIELDSNDLQDQNAFTNLMHAFSGTPAVQVISSKNEFPLQELKTAVEAQSPSVSENFKTEKSEDKVGAPDYSETEMLKMTNSELKDYATYLGIDWAKAEGKNTNRKLTDLVLAFREGVATSEEEQQALKEVDELTVKNAEAEETPEDAEDLAEDKTENLGGVDYNDLKIALNKKVDDHRAAIVAKLGEFGATLQNLQ